MNEKKFQSYRDKALNFYGKKQMKHILKVEEFSLMLCDIAGIEDEKNRQAVALAALLHDVGKSKKHNEVGAAFVKGNSFFEENDFENHRNIIAAIIKYHKGSDDYGKKDAEERKLISIVRLADKISKIYKLEKR